MGILWGIVLMLPAIVVLYTEDFAAIYMSIVVFLFLGAFRGALFLVGGENNLNLMVEAFLSVLWIAIAGTMVASGVGFPLESIYINDGSGWSIEPILPFFIDNDIPFVPFDWIWAFFIFITVAVAVWRVFVSVMKISMHLRAGRGLWWQGSWGERRKLTKPFWKRVVGGSDDPEPAGDSRQDGYAGSDNSQ